MRDDYFIFGDIDSRQYSVGIYGDQLAKAPERDQERVSVPGRNGDLILDNERYLNIIVPYKAYIIDNYNENVKGLRNALLSKHGYQKLEDSINPDEYRMAQSMPFEPNEYGVLRAAEFELQFNCKPQRFLKAGDIPIEVTTSATIYSEYDQPALPLIRAYGTGSFTIGGVTIQITSASSYTDIDCELQEAYKDSLATNCNGNIVLTNGKFPQLVKGNNAVSKSGITKLIIYPRWWIL